MSDELNLREICDEAVKYTEQVKENIDIITKPLDEGPLSKGDITELDNLLEGLQWLNDVLLMLRDLHGINFEDFYVKKKTASGIIDEYAGLIKELSEALNNNDARWFRQLLSKNLVDQMDALKELYIEVSRYC